ncbi:hypothetical protein PR048_032854 [Dryococelus australis]|uniref:Uncharacterized protein n=1 Tax=Dryococelus australis TaxID=614101 RepID=A0ABQ9G3E4_9NEOP|nr:hypothetical protein PR048_032854 [Dryococelus australis]
MERLPATLAQSVPKKTKYRSASRRAGQYVWSTGAIPAVVRSCMKRRGRGNVSDGVHDDVTKSHPSSSRPLLPQGWLYHPQRDEDNAIRVYRARPVLLAARRKGDSAEVNPCGAAHEITTYKNVGKPAAAITTTGERHCALVQASDHVETVLKQVLSLSLETVQIRLLPLRVETVLMRVLPLRVETVLMRVLPLRVDIVLLRMLSLRIEIVLIHVLLLRVETVLMRVLPLRVDIVLLRVLSLRIETVLKQVLSLRLETVQIRVLPLRVETVLMRVLSLMVLTVLMRVLPLMEFNIVHIASGAPAIPLEPPAISPAERMKILQKKGADGINRISKERCLNISVSAGDFVQCVCRKRFTDKKDIDISKRSSSEVEASVSKKRSRSGAERLLYFQGDHVAADCVHHQTCSVNFRTRKYIPYQYREESDQIKKTKLGRPENETLSQALAKVCSYIEENEDEQHIASIIANDINYKTEFDDLVIMLDSCHTLMNFLGVIRDFMAGSGLEDVLQTVYGSNTVNHILTGKAVSRAFRLTMPLAQLFCLDLSEDKSKHLVEKILFLYDDLVRHKKTISDVDNPDSLHKLNTIITEKANDLRKISVTSEVWLQYQSMVSLSCKLVQADRSGCWLSHLNATRECLPVFAAADHSNYLKSAYL